METASRKAPERKRNGCCLERKNSRTARGSRSKAVGHTRMPSAAIRPSAPVLEGEKTSFHQMRLSPTRCWIAWCFKPLGVNSRVSRCQRPSRRSRVQEELLRRRGREAQRRGTVVGKKPPPNGAPGATLRTATLRVERSVRSGATPIGDRFLAHDSTLGGPSFGKDPLSG